MAQQDLVLEASGAFERFRDPVRLWGWLAFSALLVTVGVVAIFNYEAIAADAADYEGRRSAMRGLVAPGWVGIPLLFAPFAAVTAFRSSSRWRDPNSGEALRLRLEGPIFLVASEAGKVHQRFATGDPRVYLPIRFGKNGEVGFTLHATPKAKRAFVSITEGYGKHARPLPLIVLEGGAFEAIDSLRADDWPASPSPQTISSFLDPLLR